LGEGYITRDIATIYDAEIDGFDISDNALVMARAKNAHDRISYFHLNLNDYVPDRKYDLIMCEETLYYLTDDERTSAVRMFHRAIKSGGGISRSPPSSLEKFVTESTSRSIP